MSKEAREVGADNAGQRVLTRESEVYLLSRGYTSSLIKEEGLFSVPEDHSKTQ